MFSAVVAEMELFHLFLKHVENVTEEACDVDGVYVVL